MRYASLRFRFGDEVTRMNTTRTDAYWSDTSHPRPSPPTARRSMRDFAPQPWVATQTLSANAPVMQSVDRSLDVVAFDAIVEFADVRETAPKRN
jgi:hypothetical protein